MARRRSNFSGAVFALAVFFVFLLSPGVRAAQTQTGVGRIGKEGCVTGKCHSNMGTDKFIHGPTAAGDCLFCHQKIGNHKFKATPDPVSKLCYKCHDRMDSAAHVHPPVKAGACTACHSPHQSPYKFQLRQPEGQKLCFMCHDKKMMAGPFKHGPAATGQCTICHNPHGSPNDYMLFAEGNDLCLSCHTDKAEELKNDKHIHPAVELGCVNCHSPHSAGYKYNLKLDRHEDLCFICHTGKKAHVESVKTKHGAITQTKKKCLNCHNPHGSNYPKMLLKKPIDLCLSCHDKPMDTPTGKIVNMKQYLADNKDWHGPVREGDCPACHNPHGSNNFRMLRKQFPSTMYTPYDPSAYALCFMCHQNTIPAEKYTTTLTNFRNGNLNLHYVHVHQIKGRVCVFCHDPHGSNNPKHIRDYAQFGIWHLPINYKKTATGGQCSPGCHVTRYYDRNNPVKNR